MRTRFIHASVLIFVALAGAQIGSAQGTAITYQGRLASGGSPATGTYDLTFSLFNDPLAGQLSGTVVHLPTTVVSNGLMTVLLDFGPGVFFRRVRARGLGGKRFVASPMNWRSERKEKGTDGAMPSSSAERKFGASR